MTKPRAAVVGLVVAALLCSGLCLVSRIGAIEIAASLPLVLYVPGAALLLASDPSSVRIRGSARLLWASLASLALTIAGGLILNELAGLTQTTWAAFLFGVSVVLALVAWMRAGGAGNAVLTVSGRKWLPTRMYIPTIALVGGTLLLVGGALALSAYSSATRNRESFLQLWMLPIPAGAGAEASRVRVGLANYEGHRVTFDISVDGGGRQVYYRQVTLEEGHVWTHRLARKGPETMTATVALAVNPTHTLHSVRIAAPAK